LIIVLNILLNFANINNTELLMKIALYENSSKPEAAVCAARAADYLIQRGSECCAGATLYAQFDSQLQSKIKVLSVDEFEKFADVVLSFGGDGTILSAARSMIGSETPIMGFNVGKLGFLAEFSVNELEKSLDDLLSGNYRVVDRTMLEAETDGRMIYALNDFVIEKKASSRMITIHAYANSHYIGDYRSDGLIVTTPTGSTAYSLSCGGPIIAPATQVICLTPICPHSLTLRPLVMPDTNEITLKVNSPTGQVSLVADGQSESILNNGDSVRFKKSDAFVKLIKPLVSSYFDLLRKKLLWAANAIDETRIYKDNQ
jgi:NAD+ kinase